MLKKKNPLYKVILYAAAAAAFALSYPDATCSQTESGALNISFSEDPGHAGVVKTYDYAYPYGFKISRDGSLYLSNTAKNSILQFDFMGRLIKSYSGEKGSFAATGDLAFDNDGMLYYASLKDLQIVKVDMLASERQRFGGRGTKEDELLSIYQIEAAFGKKIFVQDTVSQKINAYSSTGAFIKKIDCNVPGFSINNKGQLLYFNYDRFAGYGLFLADVNEKASRPVFTIGLSAVTDLEFIGVDYKGNVYTAASLNHKDPFGEREVNVYNSNGIHIANYSVKKSLLKRQFFVFGDGSLYSAETDASPSRPLPTKMSIRKY